MEKELNERVYEMIKEIRSITAKELVKRLQNEGFNNITDVTIRECVAFLRNNGKPIISKGTSGYAIAKKVYDIKAQAESLTNRAYSMLETAKALQSLIDGCLVNARGGLVYDSNDNLIIRGNQ